MTEQLVAPRRPLTWLAAKVAAIREEAVASRTLVLEVPGWPGNLAGQHVDVRLTAVAAGGDDGSAVGPGARGLLQARAVSVTAVSASPLTAANQGCDPRRARSDQRPKKRRHDMVLPVLLSRGRCGVDQAGDAEHILNRSSRNGVRRKEGTGLF